MNKIPAGIFTNLEVMSMPKVGLLRIRLESIPTRQEWADGCLERIEYHRSQFKAVAKIKSKKGKELRDYHELRATRWKMLHSTATIRLGSLEEKAKKGEKLEVYF